MSHEGRPGYFKRIAGVKIYKWGGPQNRTGREGSNWWKGGEGAEEENNVGRGSWMEKG